MILIVLLVYILYNEKELLKKILDISISDFFSIALLTIASWILTAFVHQNLLKSLNVQTPLFTIFCLNVTGGLLNYLPLRMGTIGRAYFFKKFNNLTYAHFSALMLVNTLLMLISTGIASILALYLGFGIENKNSLTLLLIFSFIVVVPLILLFVTFPHIRNNNRWKDFLNRIVIGRNLIIRNRLKTFFLILYHIIRFILNAYRFQIVFSYIHVEIPIIGFLILGSVGLLTLIVSFTPGALGTHEFIVASVGYLMGISFSGVIVATAIIRGAIICCYLVLGIPSVIYLKKIYFNKIPLTRIHENLY